MKIGKYLITALLIGCMTCGPSMAASTSTATGTADQSQEQGQSINGSGNGSVVDSGNLNISNSFNGSKPIRYLPVPSHVPVSTNGGPSHFGGPNYRDHGPHFMSMTVLVNVLNMIDVEEAEIKDEGDVEVVSQPINLLSPEVIDENAEKFKGERQFHLNTMSDVTKTLPGFEGIAVVTIKANDDNTMNSATLAVKLNREAEKYGATDIVLIREGSSKRLKSWGAGIGVSYNYASVTSGQDGHGSAGAGGTGLSYGEAEYVSLPYLTGIIGTVNKEVNDKAKADAEQRAREVAAVENVLNENKPTRELQVIDININVKQ